MSYVKRSNNSWFVCCLQQQYNLYNSSTTYLRVPIVGYGAVSFPLFFAIPSNIFWSCTQRQCCTITRRQTTVVSRRVMVWSLVFYYPYKRIIEYPHTTSPSNVIPLCKVDSIRAWGVETPFGALFGQKSTMHYHRLVCGAHVERLQHDVRCSRLVSSFCLVRLFDEPEFLYSAYAVQCLL